MVGEEVFRNACRQFIKHNEFSNAKRDDFLDCISKYSYENTGFEEFKKYSEDLCLQKGLNNLKVHIQYKDEKTTSSVTFIQSSCTGELE